MVFHQIPSGNVGLLLVPLSLGAHIGRLSPLVPFPELFLVFKLIQGAFELAELRFLPFVFQIVVLLSGNGLQVRIERFFIEFKDFRTPKWGTGDDVFLGDVESLFGSAEVDVLDGLVLDFPAGEVFENVGLHLDILPHCFQPSLKAIYTPARRSWKWDFFRKCRELRQAHFCLNFRTSPRCTGTAGLKTSGDLHLRICRIPITISVW